MYFSSVKHIQVPPAEETIFLSCGTLEKNCINQSRPKQSQNSNTKNLVMALPNYLCPEDTRHIDDAVVEVLPMLVCSISSMEGANGHIRRTNLH